MCEVSVSSIEEFARRVAESPLLEHLGEPFESDLVVPLRLRADLVKEWKSMPWENARNSHGNYRIAQCIGVFGKEWFEKRYEQEQHMIWAALEHTCCYFDDAWHREQLPVEKIPPLGISLQEEAKSLLYSIAFDYAYKDAVHTSFGKTYLEPLMLEGHLPCGWRGSIPRDKPPQHLYGMELVKYDASRSLEQVFGNGRVIVY